MSRRVRCHTPNEKVSRARFKDQRGSYYIIIAADPDFVRGEDVAVVDKQRQRLKTEQFSVARVCRALQRDNGILLVHACTLEQQLVRTVTTDEPSPAHNAKPPSIRVIVPVVNALSSDAR